MWRGWRVVAGDPAATPSRWQRNPESGILLVGDADGPVVPRRPARQVILMSGNAEPVRIPDERLSIEKRTDGALVVRVQSEGPAESRLPDAVFSFRCGDPQYAYWLGRLRARNTQS